MIPSALTGDEVAAVCPLQLCLDLDSARSRQEVAAAERGIPAALPLGKDEQCVLEEIGDADSDQPSEAPLDHPRAPRHSDA